MLPGAVRNSFALAAVAAMLVALTAAAPHASHGGPGANHACQACLARGGEEASSATPDGAPIAAPPVPVPTAPGLAPTYGLPQGAVPGQSPPRA